MRGSGTISTNQKAPLVFYTVHKTVPPLFAAAVPNTFNSL